MDVVRELRRVARLMKARYEDTFETPTFRLESGNNEIRLTEMPQKGMRRCHVMTLVCISRMSDTGHINAPNMIRGVNKSMSYDQAKKTILKNTEKLVEEAGKQWNHIMVGPYENEVWYLEIEPADTKPFTAEGDDFVVSASWTKFSAYSPGSDFEQSDPSYSGVKQKSATGARKLYKMLKANPDALKRVSWTVFTEWLTRNKIPYKYVNSVWR